MAETSSHFENAPIVLAITGASGIIYAARTLEWLLAEGRRVHLVVSPDGESVIRQEVGVSLQLDLDGIHEFLDAARRFLGLDDPGAIDKDLLAIHKSDDYYAPIASGSYRTSAMVICPCSGSTLAAVAHGTGRNLIHRAAEVHLKERRKLVLVPREAPLSTPCIQNMLQVSQAGAVLLPASPGWYQGVGTLRDLVDFVAARILDQLNIPHERAKRWE